MPLPFKTTIYPLTSIESFQETINYLIEKPYKIGESYEQVIDIFTKMASNEYAEKSRDCDDLSYMFFCRYNWSWKDNSNDYISCVQNSVSLNQLDECIEHVTSSTQITNAHGIVIYYP